MSEDRLKAAIDATGYTCPGIESAPYEKKGLFGAPEVAQRQYELRCEVEAYLKDHPKAAVVNPGCGPDDTFSKVDNGQCRGYNIDLTSDGECDLK